MSSWKHVYKVFIASPSDMPEIRKQVPAMFAKWNAQHQNNDFLFVPIMWETHATPGLDVPGQNRLLRDVLPQADFMIAMFWSTIGTPTRDGGSGDSKKKKDSKTNNFESGTVAEIEEFCRLRNPGNAIVCFWNRPLSEQPSNIRATKLKKLKKYRKRIRDVGLVHEFDGIDDLEAALHRHLLIKLPGVRDTDYGLRIDKLTLRELRKEDVHDPAILSHFKETHFKLEIEGVTSDTPEKSFCFTAGGPNRRWIGEDLRVKDKKWQTQLWVSKGSPNQIECLMSGPDGARLLQHNRRLAAEQRTLAAEHFLAVPTPTLLPEHYTSDMTVVRRLDFTGSDLAQIGPVDLK